MAVYAYTATDADASTARGVLTADSPRQARDLLRERGLAVQEVREQTNRGTRAGRFGTSSLGWRRVSGVRVTGFVRELSTLLGVGTPLLEALDVLANGASAGFRPVVLGLRERVAAGASLTEAMRERPDAFDAVVLSMVEVGEDAGTLDETLAQAADYRERRQQLRGRVSTALLYPGVVALFGAGVCVFLMTYVVPSLLETLTEAGRPLPWITRVVKAASDLLVQRWWLLLGGLGLLTMVAGAAWRSERARRWLDAGVLRVPLVGELVRKAATVRVAFVIATLMRSGVSFERAAVIAQRAVGNRVLRDALRRCEAAVRAGRDIAPALEAAGRWGFPPTVVQVFALGQHSGNLEEMLDRLAIDYDRQVQSAATRLASILEPILIVTLAVVIGAVAFATILPILEAGNVL